MLWSCIWFDCKWKNLVPLYSFGDTNDIRIISATFGVNSKPLHDGFTYLGYKMRPNNYRFQDWSWLLQIFHNKLTNWTHEALFFGGRFALVQFVQQQLAIYWMHLFIFSAHVITEIQSIMARFLWSGSVGDGSFHLVKWADIARPWELDGWGALNTNIFGKYVIISSMWRALFNTGILHQIFHFKYLK